jgi:hypothetical protein
LYPAAQPPRQENHSRALGTQTVEVTLAAKAANVAAVAVTVAVVVARLAVAMVRCKVHVRSAT